jgi:hypothetical protein
MKRLVLAVLLLGAASVVAAPAPFPKPPHPSGPPFWQIDVRPLLGAFDGRGTLAVAVRTREDGGWFWELRLTIKDGKVTRASSLVGGADRATGVGPIHSLVGLGAAEAVMRIVVERLGEDSAVVRGGIIIEIRRVWGLPVSEVIVTAQGLQAPFVRTPLRRR